MGCCACAGSCNHVGNHAYCVAHGGSGDPVWTVVSSGTNFPLAPVTEERIRQIIREEFAVVARSLKIAV
jgi:hypothetical protein